MDLKAKKNTFVNEYIAYATKKLLEYHQHVSVKESERGYKEDKLKSASVSVAESTQVPGVAAATKFVFFLVGRITKKIRHEQVKRVNRAIESNVQVGDRFQNLAAAGLEVFYASVVSEAAHELANIFSHQLDLLDGQSDHYVVRMAQAAVERSMDYLKHKHAQDADKYNHNMTDLLVKGVFRGTQPRESLVKDSLKTTQPRGKHKWRIPSVFTDPGVVFDSFTQDGAIEKKHYRINIEKENKHEAENIPVKYGFRAPVYYHVNGKRKREKIEKTLWLQGHPSLACKFAQDYQPVALVVNSKIVRGYLSALRAKDPMAQNGFNNYLSKKYNSPIMAIFHRLNLKDKNLSGGDFSGCIFMSVDLSDYDLTNTKLNDTLLQHAQLNNAKIDGADFSNAICDFADFTEAHATSSVNFTQARLCFACFDQAVLPKANFTKADFRYPSIKDADFSGADITGMEDAGFAYAVAKVDTLYQQGSRTAGGVEAIKTTVDSIQSTVADIKVATESYKQITKSLVPPQPSSASPDPVEQVIVKQGGKFNEHETRVDTGLAMVATRQDAAKTTLNPVMESFALKVIAAGLANPSQAKPEPKKAKTVTVEQGGTYTRMSAHAERGVALSVVPDDRVLEGGAPENAGKKLVPK